MAIVEPASLLATRGGLPTMGHSTVAVRTIFARNWYPRLAHGTPAERAHVQISGAGYGLHWPGLDEDIGVEGLLLGKKSTESAASFERWLQRRNAR